MQLEAKKFLLDVLTSCDAIQEFTAGKSLEDYTASRLIQSATEREFEVIGEALNRLRKLDPETAAEISSLDLIIAFRNRIIHGYDSVDEIIVWSATQNSVPVLRSEVQKLLER
jgi:uncharacterized protein with HEPN domain